MGLIYSKYLLSADIFRQSSVLSNDH